MSSRFLFPWRRLTRWALVVGLALAGLFRADAVAATPSRPNIIFILADDWGWGDLGCYGHPQLKTPHLDQLAREGTLFTQFYANSSVCSPTRVGFMTGRFPGTLGVHYIIDGNEASARFGVPEFLPPSLPNVARLLRDAGYATAHFGKWHLGRTKNSPLPEAYGFDTALTVNSNDPRGPKELGGPRRPHSSARIVDETLAFIGAQRAKPFFVNLWLQDTHTRLEPTEEHMAAYPNLPKDGGRRIYYSAATEADRQIGRLLQQLDERGLRENTLVIFSSDNGPEDPSLADYCVGSAGPFRGRKRSLYEGGVRVPFIVRWPAQVPAGRVDDTSVLSGVDFLPTLCALAGAPIAPADAARWQLDGEDVGLAVRGTPHQRSRPLYWENRYAVLGHTINRSPQLATREGPWKLLLNPDRSRIELYDVRKDPGEVDNLATQHPAEVAAMSERLLRWQAALPKGGVDPKVGLNQYRWPVAATPAKANPTKL